MLISATRDGNIQLLNPYDFRLIAEIRHRGKSAIFVSNMVKDMEVRQRAKHIMSLDIHQTKSDKETEKGSFLSKISITCICTLPLSAHLVVGSADNALTLYELATQEVCGTITSLQDFPTSLCSFMLSDKRVLESGKVWSEPVIALGDNKGRFFLIKLNPEFGTSNDAGAKKKNQQLFQEAISSPNSFFELPSLHTDWITQISFLEDLNSLATASMDGTIKLTDMSRESLAQRRSFEGHVGKGVKAFGYSAKGKYLVSGSVSDRRLLIWDPNSLAVVAKIDKLSAPAISITVVDELERIFAIGSDKWIRVWNTSSYELLQTIEDETLYRPENTVSSSLFVPSLQMLFTAGHLISNWTLETRADEVEDEDVDDDMCVTLYNPVFRLLVIVTVLGTVKIYEIETGSCLKIFSVLSLLDRAKIAKANATEGNSKGDEPIEPSMGVASPVVRSACFDKHYRRLIVVGFDSSVKLFNFHNGQLISTMYPSLFTLIPHDLSPQAIASSPSFVQSSINATSTIPPTVAEMRGKIKQKHIHMRESVCSMAYEVAHGRSGLTDSKNLLLLGTDCGSLYCFIEQNRTFFPEPLFKLSNFSVLTISETQKRSMALEAQSYSDFSQSFSHKTLKPSQTHKPELFGDESDLIDNHDDDPFRRDHTVSQPKERTLSAYLQTLLDHQDDSSCASSLLGDSSPILSATRQMRRRIVKITKPPEGKSYWRPKGRLSSIFIQCLSPSQDFGPPSSPRPPISPRAPSSPSPSAFNNLIGPLTKSSAPSTVKPSRSLTNKTLGQKLKFDQSTDPIESSSQLKQTSLSRKAVHPHQHLKSLFSALWVLGIEDKRAVVGFADGSLVVWDLYKVCKLFDIHPSINGPKMNCLKKKGERVKVLAPSLVAHRSLQQLDSLSSPSISSSKYSKHPTYENKVPILPENIPVQEPTSTPNRPFNSKSFASSILNLARSKGGENSALNLKPKDTHIRAGGFAVEGFQVEEEAVQSIDEPEEIPPLLEESSIVSESDSKESRSTTTHESDSQAPPVDSDLSMYQLEPTHRKLDRDISGGVGLNSHGPTPEGTGTRSINRRFRSTKRQTSSVEQNNSVSTEPINPSPIRPQQPSPSPSPARLSLWNSVLTSDGIKSTQLSKVIPHRPSTLRASFNSNRPLLLDSKPILSPSALLLTEEGEDEDEELDEFGASELADDLSSIGFDRSLELEEADEKARVNESKTPRKSISVSGCEFNFPSRRASKLLVSSVVEERKSFRQSGISPLTPRKLPTNQLVSLPFDQPEPDQPQSRPSPSPSSPRSNRMTKIKVPASEEPSHSPSPPSVSVLVGLSAVIQSPTIQSRADRMTRFGSPFLPSGSFLPSRAQELSEDLASSSASVTTSSSSTSSASHSIHLPLSPNSLASSLVISDTSTVLTTLLDKKTSAPSSPSSLVGTHQNENITITLEETETAKKESKITVICAVVLPSLNILIGSCTDGYLKFWSLDPPHASPNHSSSPASPSPLCSCGYVKVLFTNPEEGEGSLPYLVDHKPDQVEDRIRALKLANEDYLIGGYDSGLIRVWAISSSSLEALINAQLEQADSGNPSNFRMGQAFSPLQLLFEWVAHLCPIFSLEYVPFDMSEEVRPYRDAMKSEGWTEDAGEDEPQDDLLFLGSEQPLLDSGEFDPDNSGDQPRAQDKQAPTIAFSSSSDPEDKIQGFLISSSFDQDVILWTIRGEYVGRFSIFNWDIRDPRTWKRRPKNTSQISQKNKLISMNHRRSKSKNEDSSIHPQLSDSGTCRSKTSSQELLTRIDKLAEIISHRQMNPNEHQLSLAEIMKAHPSKEPDHKKIITSLKSERTNKLKELGMSV